MKKIMFNDRYGLTQAVLKGKKTITRRIIPDIWIDFPRSGRQKAVIAGLDSQVLMMDLSHVLGENCLYSAERKYQPKYYKDDEVAVAQTYKDCGWSPDVLQEIFVRKPTVFPDLDPISTHLGWVDLPLKYHKGWTNKMFVRADLMPHRIRITNIKGERLQDISEEDILREGIRKSVVEFGGKKIVQWTYFQENRTIWFDTPFEAFAALIDRISGRGTWERNPWVYAYEFELIK